jgi:hypothetical protein
MFSGNGSFWTLSRVMSGMVAVGYVVLDGIYYGVGSALYTAAFCVLPLGCIWFSRAMGRYRGIGLAFPVYVRRPSPASMVFALGWVVLLLPAALLLIGLLLRGGCR